MDHASEGIRCNYVCPTWVQTSLLDVELRKNPQVQAKISAVVPIEEPPNPKKFRMPLLSCAALQRAISMGQVWSLITPSQLLLDYIEH